MKRSEIRVRDPYIVCDEGTYYLYVTTGDTTLSYYVSCDLENWEYGGVAFEIPEDFWAYKDVWAGEIHKYRERFYLFVSLIGKNGLRGTQIAVSDTPAGPFIPVADHAATPLSQSCIDGTLFVENGTPYMVYSHDWPDNYQKDRNVYVGEICAVRLSDDLTEIAGDPWVLFGSDEAPLSFDNPHKINYNGHQAIRYGSDAPFVQRLSNGALYLTWSPYLADHYVVLGAISISGSLRGPWTHLSAPLFEENGGHAMFFKTAEGKNCMCIHAPEKQKLERACLFEVGEKNGELYTIKEL
ncbi:MAG: family 43 glycosylhydrolase [Clostridia bacterium]|nr:family 43 glycosylhydrolase [Clostridia bacterium]